MVHYQRYTADIRSLVTGHNLVQCCGIMIILSWVAAGDSHHFLCSFLLRATQATVGAPLRMCSLCSAGRRQPPPVTVFSHSQSGQPPPATTAPPHHQPAQLNVTLIFSFTGTPSYHHHIIISSSQPGVSHSRLIALAGPRCLLPEALLIQLGHVSVNPPDLCLKWRGTTTLQAAMPGKLKSPNFSSKFQQYLR